MRKTFPAHLSALYSMLNFIDENVNKIGFDISFQPKFELAAEEALINIINYSNMGHEGKIEIECTHINDSNTQGIKIVFRDSGIPYDPIAHAKKISLDLPLEDREPGGFGIFLMQKLMDNISYKRVGDHNELTLVKHLPVTVKK